MQTVVLQDSSSRYLKTIETSKRIRWDIDSDVIRGRQFDFSKKFLPNGLTLVSRFEFLTSDEKRQLSQIQGRTYVNMFGLVERFIAAKMLEVSRDHWLGDQRALEALVRFSDEELKHQELFRRLERLAAEDMPAGYVFVPNPNDVAQFVLGKSTWAVLALTCHIELFTQAHYRATIEPDMALSDLFKDVLLYHWKEESQHVILDELEWHREDMKLTPDARDEAVYDLIELVSGVDGLLQAQAAADAAYFIQTAGRTFNATESAQIRDGLLKAYRWQYIVSGVDEPRFANMLGSLLNSAQLRRIGEALSAIVGHVRSQ
jgi:hypothetical protein